MKMLSALLILISLPMVALAQTFLLPSWVQGSQATDPEPPRCVSLVLDPYNGWSVRVLCRRDPSDPLRPASMPPNTFQYLIGAGPFPQNGGQALARAWVQANLPIPAGYKGWVWSNTGDIGTLTK